MTTTEAPPERPAPRVRGSLRNNLRRTLLRRVIRSVVVRALLTKERLQSGVTFNPLSLQWYEDPVPLYRRLREKDPVHYSELIRGWVFSRHEDIDAILRDHERFSNDPTARISRNGGGEPVEGVASMLNLDPPDHTRMRALVSRAFTPRAIEGWRPRIEAVIDDIFADIGDETRFDLMDRVAVPLPIVVIAEILGIPAVDRERFKVWSDHIARPLEPTVTPDELAQARVSGDELTAYFEAIIEERRAQPQNDLITALVQVEESGDTLSRDEIVATLVLLLVAGNETTTNLIGNGTLALLRHPDQLAWLRAHPEQVDVATEEMLRFDSPVQTNGRTALVDMEIGGRRIRKGQSIILLQGSANHDPAKWHEADALDLARGDKGHMSFGRGIHFCLGAPLARLEAQLLFPRMLERWPAMRLASKPRFKDHIVLRGMESMEVAVD
ncbi:MAG: cytochrome P450 [Dehalococcoidia bacterium]